MMRAGQQNEFEEDGDPTRVPETGAYRITSKPPPPRWRHTADTRRFMAYGIVGVTLALYSYLTVAVV